MRIRLLLLMLCFGSLTFAQVKTVSVLGDSYSAFRGDVSPSSNAVYYSTSDTRTDVRSANQMWYNIVIAKERWSLDTNNSYSGSTICNTGYGGSDDSSFSYTRRMSDLGDPDIIFIFGATNDNWAGAPMGDYTYSDFSTSNLRYFRPAMADLIDGTLSRYPRAKVYFILNNGLSGNINNSVKTICDHYGITCIELSDISKSNNHPNVRGQQQIAAQVIEVLERERTVSSIINYDDPGEEPIANPMGDEEIEEPSGDEPTDDEPADDEPADDEPSDTPFDDQSDDQTDDASGDSSDGTLDDSSDDEGANDEEAGQMDQGKEEGATAIIAPTASGQPVAEWFTLDGLPLSSPRRGLVLKRTNDGRIIKQVVK